MTEPASASVPAPGPVATPASLRANRRELLGGALAGVAASALIPASAAAAGPVVGGGDGKHLVSLLGAERILRRNYRQVLASGALGVVVAAEVNGFLAQEQQHISALERELGLRGKPVPPETALEPGVQVESQADALQALVKAEEATERAYLSALSKLEDPALVRLATEIMGSEAQHAALLRVLQSPGDLSVAAPVAFVVGS